MGRRWKFNNDDPLTLLLAIVVLIAAFICAAQVLLDRLR